VTTALTVHQPQEVAVAPAAPRLALLRPIAPVADVLVAQNEMRDLIAKTLQKGRDFGTVPGTDKPTLYKPGAERVNGALGLTPRFRIVEQEVDHDRVVPWRKTKHKYEWKNGKKGRKIGEEVVTGESYGLYRYVVECELVHRESGQVVASCIGSCSTMESKYIDRPRDCENTALKMAGKRSYVGATLLAAGLSDQFTQDVEDLPREMFERGDDEGTAASAANGASVAEPEPRCPTCNGEMWDNRASKTNPRAPDFKCKDRSCDGVFWPGQWPPKPKDEPNAQQEIPATSAALVFPTKMPTQLRDVQGKTLGACSTEQLTRALDYLRHKGGEAGERWIEPISAVLEDRRNQADPPPTSAPSTPPNASPNAAARGRQPHSIGAVRGLDDDLPPEPPDDDDTPF